jgi:para-aminobenzoate synthetase component 1
VGLFNSNKNLEGFKDCVYLSNKLPVSVVLPATNYIAFINYDHKNAIEQFPFKNTNPLQFPQHAFVETEKIIALEELLQPMTSLPSLNIIAKPVINKEQYLEHVDALKKHIRLGDIYEINYCMSFEAADIRIDPFMLYQKLNAISHAPYSAFAKFGHHYIISSSPELFLSKKGTTLFTKPIKGTAKRGSDAAEDEALKQALRHNAKEQNENVMIVDVARNDLSRLAKKGSVKVDKLFDIESYPQVHQMVSTVSCSVKENTSFQDIIHATFPMASMTGAPKYRAMQLIDHYERYNRGPYSGALGYIDASSDFDLNVLIRSVFYDDKKRYLSFTVGSAITDLCNAEDEYEECLLKARAMMQALAS